MILYNVHERIKACTGNLYLTPIFTLMRSIVNISNTNHDMIYTKRSANIPEITKQNNAKKKLLLWSHNFHGKTSGSYCHRLNISKIGMPLAWSDNILFA